MKLYLLLTLALVAVQMSLAEVSQGDESDNVTPNPRDYYCADCSLPKHGVALPNGVRWLCIQSNPPMLCPVSNHDYCKNFCKGAATRMSVPKQDARV